MRRLVQEEGDEKHSLIMQAVQQFNDSSITTLRDSGRSTPPCDFTPPPAVLHSNIPIPSYIKLLTSHVPLSLCLEHSWPHG